MRLLFAWYRRPLAAFLGLACLWVTIRSAAPSPPASVAVTVAAHDLPAAHRLTAGDLRAAAWPASKAPAGRLASATGLVLATPLHAGEPLTDTRVIGPGLLAGQPSGTVAVPVRLGDPAAGALVRAGDRVDVLVSSSASSWTSEPDLADGTDDPDDPASSGGAESSSGAERVASNALVLAVPGGSGLMDDDSLDGGSGGSGGSGLTGLGGGGSDPSSSGSTAAGEIVLAVESVESVEAARLAAAQSGSFIGIAVLPRP